MTVMGSGSSSRAPCVRGSGALASAFEQRRHIIGRGHLAPATRRCERHVATQSAYPPEFSVNADIPDRRPSATRSGTHATQHRISGRDELPCPRRRSPRIARAQSHALKKYGLWRHEEEGPLRQRVVGKRQLAVACRSHHIVPDLPDKLAHLDWDARCQRQRKRACDGRPL